jgi:hypothetical protein
VQSEELQAPAAQVHPPDERRQAVTCEVGLRHRIERPATQDADAVGVLADQELLVRIARLPRQFRGPGRGHLLYHDQVGRVRRQPLQERPVVTVPVPHIDRDHGECGSFAGRNGLAGQGVLYSGQRMEQGEGRRERRGPGVAEPHEHRCEQERDRRVLQSEVREQFERPAERREQRADGRGTDAAEQQEDQEAPVSHDFVAGENRPATPL